MTSPYCLCLTSYLTESTKSQNLEKTPGFKGRGRELLWLMERFYSTARKSGFMIQKLYFSYEALLGWEETNLLIMLYKQRKIIFSIPFHLCHSPRVSGSLYRGKKYIIIFHLIASGTRSRKMRCWHTVIYCEEFNRTYVSDLENLLCLFRVKWIKEKFLKTKQQHCWNSNHVLPHSF